MCAGGHFARASRERDANVARTPPAGTERAANTRISRQKMGRRERDHVHGVPFRSRYLLSRVTLGNSDGPALDSPHVGGLRAQASVPIAIVVESGLPSSQMLRRTAVALAEAVRPA